MDGVAERSKRLFANEHICFASRSSDLWPPSNATLLQQHSVNIDEKENDYWGAQHKVELLKMIYDFGVSERKQR